MEDVFINDFITLEILYGIFTCIFGEKDNIRKWWFNMKLFDESGNPIGLYEIAQWFIDTYPEDIFIIKPKIIIEIRDKLKEILKKRKL